MQSQGCPCEGAFSDSPLAKKKCRIGRLSGLSQLETTSSTSFDMKEMNIHRQNFVKVEREFLTKV